MRTVKVRINTGTDQYDRPLGPPLPRSMQLWNIWGCYVHPRCVATNNPVTRVVSHQTPEQFLIDEHNYCTGAANGCRYWVHWLAGELEEPGIEGDEAWMYDLSKTLTLF